MQEGISQQAKAGANLVEPTMPVAVVRMMKTNEGSTLICLPIHVLIVARPIYAVLSLTMYAAISPTV